MIRLSKEMLSLPAFVTRCRRLVTSSSATLVVVLGLTCAAGQSAAADTWTDASGGFSVEADFLGIRGVTVYLKKANGTTIAVPLAKLSTESQQLARRLATPTPAAGAEDTAEAAARALMASVEQGNFFAAWDSMPSSYQQDVHDVIKLFAETMDTDLWNTGANIGRKAVGVLKNKKEFILGYPAIAQGPVDANMLGANWDAFVDVLDVVVNSDLTKLDKLKTMDVGEFLQGDGKAIGLKMAALAASVEQSGVSADDFPGVPVEAMPLSGLSKGSISTVSSSGDTAVLKIVREDGTEEEVQAVRVEGKWLPKEMVDDWQANIDEAKNAISAQMGPALAQGKQQALLPMKMVEGVLDQLLAAPDQAAFNQVIDGVMQMFGAPDGPPGGAPGDADPFGGDADPFGAAPGEDSGAGNDPFGN